MPSCTLVCSTATLRALLTHKQAHFPTRLKTMFSVIKPSGNIYNIHHSVRQMKRCLMTTSGLWSNRKLSSATRIVKKDATLIPSSRNMCQIPQPESWHPQCVTSRSLRLNNMNKCQQLKDDFEFPMLNPRLQENNHAVNLKRLSNHVDEAQEHDYKQTSQVGIFVWHSIGIRHQKMPLSKSLLSVLASKLARIHHCHWTQVKPCMMLLSVRMKYTDPFPYLREEDLQEQFVRGHGPGGQSVNKTTNCVVLKHKPTGIVIKCHETRSLDTNRERARIRMKEKLDWYFNRENSLAEQERKQASRERQEKKRRTRDKLEKLKAFKEREGLD